MFTARVITVSDRSFRGEREDRGGPLVREVLEGAGYAVDAVVVVPDEKEMIMEALITAADEDVALIVTTGVTSRAMLSRAAAGIRRRSLILNLPGSPKGARENLEAVLPALDHGLETLRGPAGDCAPAER